MKPTLNEEIGMSQEGIDYVNSLEVKESENISKRIEANKKLNAILNDPKTHDFMRYVDNQRIKKQSQKVWGFVFATIVIIVTYFLNR